MRGAGRAITHRAENQVFPCVLLQLYHAFLYHGLGRFV